MAELFHDENASANALNRYRWRDRILALACWATVFFMAAYYWATPPPGSPAEELLASNPLRTVEPPTARSLPLLLTGGVPLLLFGLSAIPRGNDLVGRALGASGRPPILAALLIALAALLAPPLIPLGLSTPAQELAITVVAALILLWLFYRRERTDRRLLLAVGFWLLILIVSRQTLLLFPGNVDLMAASWRTRALFAIHAGAYALGLIGPVSLLVPHIRRLISRAAFPKSAALLTATVFGTAAVAAWLLLQAGAADPLRTRFILQTLTLLAIFFAFLFAISPSEGRTLQPPARLPDISPALQRGLLLMAIAAFTALALIVNRNLLPSLNPDGIAYMTIARSYAEGKVVVRGYWSPLISWILAVPMSMGVEPNVAFRSTLVLSVIVMMAASLGLARNMGLTRAASVLVSSTLGLVILASGGFNSLTPDLLGGAVVGVYLWWLTRPELLERPYRDGGVAGVLAALAYYAKYYNFTFAVPHLLATGLLLAAHGRRSRSTAAAFGFALLTLGMAMLPWLIAIKARYGYFTLTTSAEINRAIVLRSGFPWWDRRLVTTPSDILFPWEDPDPEVVEMHDWSPFRSLAELQFQIRLVKANLWWLTGQLAAKTGPLPLLALVVSTAVLLIDWHTSQQRLRRGWLLLSACFYVSGYLLAHASEFRFYFTLLPLILVIAFSALEEASRSIVTAAGKHTAARLVAIGLLILASLTLVRWDGLRTVLARRVGPCFQDGAVAMAPHLVAPIAGSDPQVNYVSYLTRQRTFGVLTPDTPAFAADAQLQAMGVRTYLSPAGSSLSEGLVTRLGYVRLATVAVCGKAYDVLRVPY